MKRWIILLLVAVSFSSCKKYPEGPGLTFRTPLQRILGTWKVNAYLVDDVDSVSYYNQYNTGIQLGFGSEETDNGYQGHTRCGDDSTNYYYATTYWSFINDKDDLQIETHKQTNLIGFTGPLSDPATVTYKILRLTHDELWLEVDYDGSHYELQCQKI